MSRKRELREAQERIESYRKLWYEEVGRGDGLRHRVSALSEELNEAKKEIARLKVENEAQREYIAAQMRGMAMRDAAVTNPYPEGPSDGGPC